MYSCLPITASAKNVPRNLPPAIARQTRGSRAPGGLRDRGKACARVGGEVDGDRHEGRWRPGNAARCAASTVMYSAA